MTAPPPTDPGMRDSKERESKRPSTIFCLVYHESCYILGPVSDGAEALDGAGPAVAAWERLLQAAAAHPCLHRQVVMKHPTTEFRE